MDDGSEAGRRPGWHDGAGEVALHPSSACHPLETQQLQRPYLVYLDKARSGGLCGGGLDLAVQMGGSAPREGVPSAGDAAAAAAERG